MEDRLGSWQAMELPRNQHRLTLTRADRVAISVGLLASILGGALLAVVPGFTALLVGVGLLGLAGIAFVALVFLLVGESEDREYRKGV
jgi:hypothetical protein